MTLLYSSDPFYYILGVTGITVYPSGDTSQCHPGVLQSDNLSICFFRHIFFPTPIGLPAFSISLPPCLLAECRYKRFPCCCPHCILQRYMVAYDICVFIPFSIFFRCFCRAQSLQCLLHLHRKDQTVRIPVNGLYQFSIFYPVQCFRHVICPAR